MGSLHAPFAGLLKAMNWRVVAVPFKFYVVRPFRFLREIQPLHAQTGKSFAANAAAWSGLGYLGIQAMQMNRRRKAGGSRSHLAIERIGSWGEWCDALWAAYCGTCSFAALRDSENLPRFLDPRAGGLIVHRIAENGRIRGWAASQLKQMRADKYFGNLQVATLLDAVSEPDFERALISQVIAALREKGAELIIANHAHATWLRALEAAGFWNGPSNYVLATSPQLTESIAAVNPTLDRLHLTRADGDGRIHLS
jgi:hypothetical protein